MFSSYLKIAWRNIVKNKGYAAINIAGLAVGVCCFILIALFVKHEFSYDKFHANADRIYRVWQYENYGPKEDFLNTTTPVSMVNVLRENFPEIENGSRVFRFNSLVKRNESEFNESIRAVDPSFFEIFDFDIVAGNSEKPLATANAIVLTQSAATKYFGNEDPLGKSLSLEFNDEVRVYEVSAIAADPPQASSIQFQLLVSLANEALFFGERIRTSWFNVPVESYLLLGPEMSATQLEAKFPATIKQYLGDNYEEDTFFLHLQPMTAIHHDTSLPAGIEPISNPRYAYVLATIGFLVLLLACINFVTLAVGRSFSRATEVGVRKALGAFRKQIVHQFWGEALLITLMAVTFGVLLAFLFQDTFNSLTGKELLITLDLSFWVITLILVVFIALIAGIYPSIVLSRFNPIQVLRRKKGKGASMGFLGKSLVITQFVASIVMLIGTLVIGRQIDYLVTKDLGYKQDAIVVVPTNMSGEEADEFADLYVAELKKQPLVSDASRSLYSFMENGWVDAGFTDATNTYREFAFNLIDPNFLKTHGIPIVEGRDFISGSESDAQNGVLVNETFVKEFGLENPIGVTYDKFNVKILGVVKDFNFLSLNNTIDPLLMAINPTPILTHAENLETQYTAQPRVSVKLNTEDLSSSISTLKSSWEKINPTQEFEYSFLDEALMVQYQNELRSKSIVNIASILSFFIACMGLFGLATLNVARRTAEIGIRKVMGAGVMNIVGMISLDFIKLVLIALLLAFPIAWWAMDQWLQSFAYSTGISWWIFVIAGIIVIGITLITVSFQSIRASLINPVISLRTE
ncbi:ABC transporter permease [Muriicola sp. Z0-33]|uniref:ABC transporter permease n=1 Tax=Muriicola sp. Z0-33 TaxID=2816957 RepID=UPI0022372492|nr:ABC transporter permease [Muriicola sp. Z0-33]MCW5515042.1 ABC transporter permease [Muriicola sp. Z0-33]